ncbi:stage II sporulation protein M [Sanguibacter inulinus]|uniref:Stage II sporulation protein M n=1 Tax=Sanguibacter inulinus TaxID=60922 RepID=A0A853EXC5_9MICO|nr:stage II sporulation protein M [Sanguibacter inulinus]MBF0723329.1 stage II sporulation protein M [Sanguibacter inulinus]NYS94474.1 stage II sporulation protein M [Sanguibacter inulinus]
MDLDAFSDVHRGEWERLKQLSGRRRLDGAESDELVRLYQTVATHLSTLRSSAPDPVLVSELSQTLNRARTTIAGAHEPAWRDVKTFVLVSLPAAFYRLRWWVVAVTLACLLLAVVSGVWVATTPQGLAAVGPPSYREEYVESAFASYYDPGAGFAAVVWTNNAWIAAQCVAFGITGIWPAYMLVQNFVMVGAIGGMMAHYGELGMFLQLITPHGLLELTSILVAGAAGLKIFWTLVSPGPRPRGRAVAEEGRSLFTVAVGLVATLALSGLVEGFVTGSSLVWWLKIVIGALALAVFWVYVLVLGRRAVAQGATGDLDEERAGSVQQVAG